MDFENLFLSLSAMPLQSQIRILKEKLLQTQDSLNLTSNGYRNNQNVLSEVMMIQEEIVWAVQNNQLKEVVRLVD